MVIVSGVVEPRQDQLRGRVERIVERQLPRYVLADLEVGRRAPHSAPTVERVPFTDEGALRLAAELERAQQPIDPPRPVWLFDRDTLREVRASLHGWRDGPPRRGLILRHEPGPVDRIEWVCEPYVRRRHE